MKTQDRFDLLAVRIALEGIKAELDALAALKGFRFRRMREFVGAGLKALSAVTAGEI